eukprot:TRINITY_DN1008_c0_g1_i1.p1 TRINITY_DN1008_c0_g1~~TRINITY_DN1008_c0_g1_i1.p1  ORF type:complete len:627 (-),score=103.31 TRINITY_DN1008_c0_g1_i1:66-1886(-)
MKAASCALTFAVVASSFSSALAKKIRAKSEPANPAALLVTDVSTEAEPWCMGNIFPSPQKEFQVGLSTSLQVFPDSDLTALRTALTNNAAWSFDRVWEFKAKVTSGFAKPLDFGMAGGAGFLKFTVPANAGAATIAVQGKVKTEAGYVSLVYRGSPTDLVTHKVTFSQVCVRQLPCAQFPGCLPAYKYKPNVSANGDSFESCCEPIYCKDTVTCAPETKYENYSDADTRMGNTLDLCCNPKLCSATSSTLCTGDNKPKHGSGILGSTASECCELAYCRDFTGCDPTHDTSALPINNEDGTPRVGGSEEECCNVIECSAFNCSKSDLWKNKSNQSGKGHSFSQCCEPLFCSNYTCQESTKYVQMDSPPVQGNSDDRCCEAVYCANYTCSNSSMAKMNGAATRLGSTDGECCEPALCQNYNCSDSTKYWKKPNMVETAGVQGPRFGGTDAECCTPLYCSNFSCTSTKWKHKEVQDDTVLGWTHEQCCDKIYCENYTCTTDFDGDGNGTKWYKRADTNALKWQGSTDEECCYPLYCSQFSTLFPSQWKRKTSTTPLLGSTEPECYEPVFCSNFCGCKEAKGTRLVADASGVQGSTVDECCENITAAASS